MNSTGNRSTWNGAIVVGLGILLGALTWPWLGFIVVALGLADSLYCLLRG